MKKTYFFAVSFLALGIGATAQSTFEEVSIRNDLTNYFRATYQTFYKGTAIPSFNPKEETVGSRYLYDKWVHGSVITVKDSFFDKPNLFFNYDKLTGNLLLTEDKKTAVEVYLDQVKSFGFKDEGKEYKFERVRVINTEDFFQPIVKSDKYSLYKLLRTKFIRSNYSTNGISETGHKYDEYKDEFTYYVVLPGGNESRKVELRKKSIRQVLSMEAAKEDEYFSKHSAGELDEAFLTGLILFLNQ